MTIEVPVKPKFKWEFRKSAAVSPTVVAMIFMIQKKMVTSGTLFSVGAFPLFKSVFNGFSPNRNFRTIVASTTSIKHYTGRASNAPASVCVPTNAIAPSPPASQASYCDGSRTIGARSWTVPKNSFGGTVTIV